MPCMTPEPTPEELRRSEISYNKREYGIGKTTNEIIADLINMNCEMAQIIRENGLFDVLGPKTAKWVVNHENRDKQKRKEELTRSLSQKCQLWTDLKDNADSLMKKVNTLSTEIEQIKSELNNFD